MSGFDEINRYVPVIGIRGTVKLGGLRLGGAGAIGYSRWMPTSRGPLYAGCRYPTELIACAAWLCFRFPLSLRMAEGMLAARGIPGDAWDDPAVGPEVRPGARQPHPSARALPRGRMAPGRSCHRRQEALALARDWPGGLCSRCPGPGPALRDKKAAKRLLRKLLKKQGRAPRVPVTDKLRSCAAAKREIMPGVGHPQHKGLNNRAENSRQPTRRRERIMKRFKSPRQVQRFLSTHDQIANVFSRRNQDTAAKGTAARSGV